MPLTIRIPILGNRGGAKKRSCYGKSTIRNGLRALSILLHLTVSACTDMYLII